MVTISLPKMASTDMAVGVVGATSGILVSEYAASSLVSAANLSGNAALAGGIGTKLAIGLGSFWGAGKLTGTGATALGLFGVGTLASMAIDVIHRAFPRTTEAGASLRARFTPVRGVAAPIQVRPAAAPAVPVTAPPIGIEIKR